MIVVIQGGAGRRPQAGHMKTRDGRRVLFVADPAQAPGAERVCHAHPDALSGFGAPWRKLVESYNTNPRHNPLGLLPAWQLYPAEIYQQLVEGLGPDKTYVLSAGWGLVPASFLTPNYDITLSPGAEPFRQRQPAGAWADFRMLPANSDQQVHFFGGAAYVPLFCTLTASHAGRRIVYYYHADRPPEAPGCELRSFACDERTNWHHRCAAAFLSARPEPRSEQAAPEQPAPKVSNIEARLRALQKLRGGAASFADGSSEPDARAVGAAIRAARDEIAEYCWLRRTCREVDATRDEEFQQRFNAFHRIPQRSQHWHSVYYRLLEVSRLVGAEFVDVLYELWEDTGRYEPALASRLVATIDPDQPLWDRFALLRCGLRAPAYPDPDKLDKAAQLYRRLREWYADYLKSPGARRILEQFDEAAPDFAHLSALKKIEFALRHAQAEHQRFTVAG